jgi:transcription antitermination factor NusG
LKKSPAATPLDPARIPNEGFHGLQWFCVYTSPRAEYKIARWLEETQAAFTLVPLETRWIFPKTPAKAQKHRHSGKRAQRVAKIPVQHPWLPRHIFAGFSESPDWMALDRKQGLRGRVETVKGKPALFRAKEIERLQRQSSLLRMSAQINAVPLVKTGGIYRISEPGLFQGRSFEAGVIEGRLLTIAAWLEDGGELVEPPFPIRVYIDGLG